MVTFELVNADGVLTHLTCVALLLTLPRVGDASVNQKSQVLKFKVSSESNLAAVKQMKGDFWSGLSKNKDVVVAVKGSDVQNFTSRLRSMKIKPTVEIADLDAYVQKKKSSPNLRTRKTQSTGDPGVIDWKRYWPLENIHAFLVRIASENPDVAKVMSMGKSTEGRDLALIKIGYPSKGLQRGGKSSNCRKAGYFIDAGIHAREWAAPATATYIINELVTKKDKHKKLLEIMDFYIIPSANPDGYVFTWTKERMWRKTRSNVVGSKKSECIGVDPNRNFGYHFGEMGTSDDPCEEIYRGKSPFTEAETIAIRDFVKKKRDEGVGWVIYTAIHSYGQVILYPWGYAQAFTNDTKELDKVAKLAQAAVKAVHGNVYEVGNSAKLMGEGAGGSDDWAKGSGFFEYAYTFEVRPSQARPHVNFLLPEEEIQGTAEEVCAGILTMATYVAGIKGKQH